MTDYTYVDKDRGTDAPWFEISDKIQHVYIENGCTHIGTRAFYHINNISKVVLPDTVESIGERAFDSCENLQSINLPNGLTYIGGDSFRGAPIESVTLPDNITAFGADCFAKDTQITWRGNIYNGTHELMDKMVEAGIEIPGSAAPALERPVIESPE